MNTTRYNSKKCKACGTFTSALLTADELRAIDMFYSWPKTQPEPATSVRRHMSGNLVCACRGCAKLMYVFPVHGKFSAKHECNAKCLSSHGFICECSCGGKNHGAGHAA